MMESELFQEKRAKFAKNVGVNGQKLKFLE